jgi:hypothetical protein
MHFGISASYGVVVTIQIIDVPYLIDGMANII